MRGGGQPMYGVIEDGCRCCGGAAFVILSVKFPMGGTNVSVRCDYCRRHCPQQPRDGECRKPVRTA